MVYIFDEVDCFTDEDYYFMLSLASEERRKKSLGYRFMSDRKISLLAYLLLVYALRYEYRIYQTPEFLFGEYVKPYLKDSDIFFSLSHTGKGVMCAVGGYEIGCDIESRVPYVLTADGIFSRAEMDRIGEDRDMFTSIWTLKEAYGKCLGFGLMKDLARVDFSMHINEECFQYEDTWLFHTRKNGLFYSVCVKGANVEMPEISFLKREDIMLLKEEFPYRRNASE